VVCDLKTILQSTHWSLVVALAAAGSFSLIGATMAPATPKAVTAPTATLQLSPDQGPPGTEVTLRGYVPGVTASQALEGGNIYFGGWPDGLAVSSDHTIWSASNPGHFVTHFTVPTTAWLSPNGESRLKDGAVTIGIQCFGGVMEGCGLRPDQASALFHLTDVTAKANPLPSLTVTPQSAKPGATVTLSGWAPLTEEFGTTAFGYQVVWEQNGKTTAYGNIGSVQQRLNGDITGTVQIPAMASPIGMLSGRGHLALQYVFTDVSQNNPRRADTETIDATPFTVTSPLSWTQLTRHTTLTNLTSNQNRGYFSSVAVSGATIYTASSGNLWVSHNGGRNWAALPIPSLDATERSMGYAPFNQSNLIGLVLAPGSSNHLLASVSVDAPKLGAPPILNVGVESSNGGQTWAAVPAPHGMTSSDFGGFQVEGRAVWAWWQSSKGTIAVEASQDGGLLWHLVQPSKLTSQVLLLGPVPASNYGQMSTQTEPIVTAVRGAWKVLQHPVVNEGTITQLATLSNHATLWLGNLSYPVEISTNGGQSFSYVNTPSVPGSLKSMELPLVRLLPNGALLAQDPKTSAYYRLNWGASQWKLVPSADTLAGATILVAGSKVYWLKQSFNSAAKTKQPTMLTVPVSLY